MNRRVFTAAGLAACLSGCLEGAGTQAAPAPEPAVDLHKALRTQAKVLLPAGTFVIRSRLPAGSIEGVGPDTKIIMADECDILMDGGGTAVLQNLALIGNNRGSAYATGMAVNIRRGTAYLDRVHLENFHASYWVCVENGSLEAYSCTALSRPGNAPDGRTIQQIASVFALYGGGGRIENCEFDLPHIKSAAAVFRDGQLAVVKSIIRNAGSSGEIANESGAYGILAYPDGGKAPDLRVDGCQIANARSCGIYAAEARYVDVRHSTFEDINVDAAPWEIPKAAIALNQVVAFYEEDNHFRNNHHDIVAAWPTGKYEMRR